METSESLTQDVGSNRPDLDILEDIEIEELGLGEKGEGKGMASKNGNSSKKPDPKLNGTSAMWKHHASCLKKHEAGKNQTTLSQDHSGALLSKQFSQERARLALCKMIILDEQPFRCVEREGLRLLCHELQPKFKIPSRYTIRFDCVKLFLEEREQLKVFFSRKCMGRVSITTDCWTEVNNTNFICVKTHCIDKEWRLHKKIISFFDISSHKGDDLAEANEVHLQCEKHAYYQWAIFSSEGSSARSKSFTDITKHGGRVLSTFRNSLALEMVEALICSEDWLRSSSSSTDLMEEAIQNSQNYGTLGCVEGIEGVVLAKQMDSLQTIIININSTMKEFGGIVSSLEKVVRDSKQLAKVGSAQMTGKQLKLQIGVKPTIAYCIEGLRLLEEMHRSEYLLKLSIVSALPALALKPSASADLGALQQLLVDQPNIPQEEEGKFDGLEHSLLNGNGERSIIDCSDLNQRKANFRIL
ncbi:hypothetical protein SASPL_101497 [Salvia splendens]|uniref:HAT C-terminal dimerisation domain-containing protein n=1 Tax=Salvia splendens TaxID=180675 RepID=A0A8X8YQ54_SALSN|nr:hypothetical protein SASPL_101497 [Salvia splendens]